MTTVNDVKNPEGGRFEPQVVYIVSVDDDAAVANMERDSLTINLNEESEEFEAHSSRNVRSSATTSDPDLEFTLARGEDAEAFDVLGIRDDDDDGLHVRGSEREKDRIEIWYYAADADPTEESPDLIDAFEECRVDVDDVSTDTVAGLVSVTIDIQGDIYWDTTSDLETKTE